MISNIPRQASALASSLLAAHSRVRQGPVLALLVPSSRSFLHVSLAEQDGTQSPEKLDKSEHEWHCDFILVAPNVTFALFNCCLTVGVIFFKAVGSMCRK